MFPRPRPALSLCLLAAGLIVCPTSKGRVIATAPGQPTGALSGRIIYTSAGHGWTYHNSADRWYTQRADNNEIIEDYGNLDQMNLFVAYCFNAGATVVAFRPIGYQTNEVVLDNDSPSVLYTSPWSDSTATSSFFGSPGDVPYRFASIGPAETATAIYTPTIPATGFYPVYTWASHGGNRTLQLYLINHTGGQAKVRVPHHKVGNGWVYLGTYYFEAGSNSARGSVAISNLEPIPSVGAVVIADAIRFGNGMGDVVPTSTGGGTPTVSGYPREEECARYWIQRMLGVGAPASLYDTPGSSDGDDNVGAPPRMAREMNRETAGTMAERLFLSFHSNASGVTPPSARGCVGLYNDESLFPGTATPNQFRLAQLIATELNNDMGTLTSPPLEVLWFSRSPASLTFARSDFAFGEINNNAIIDEFDATIIEVGFHDNPDDARLLRDPRVRNAMARASYQGVVRYMTEIGGVPLNFLPEPPSNVRAVANHEGGISVTWSAPGPGGGGVAGYLVYLSTNGYGFGNPVGVPASAVTSLLFTNLAPDRTWYFRVSATNAGGESMPSETVGCRYSPEGKARVLIVNGFDRFERTLAPRQTVGPGVGGPNGGTETFDRMLPRLMNSFDYVVQHGQAVSRWGVPFDSCQNDVILTGQVALSNYPAVIWALGEESTVDETFSNAEQNRVTMFLNQGGRLFLSGSEVAWDLGRASGPTAPDRAFLQNQLHASLNGDTNDDAGTYAFASVAGGLFGGNPSGRFDSGIYDVRFPDVLTPVGAGAQAALSYTGALPGAAAIQHADSTTDSRLVFLGFPFETIRDAVLREEMMFDVLSYFGVVPPPVLAAPSIQWPQETVTLSWSAVPGRRYRVQFKNDLGAPAWTNLGPVVLAADDTASLVDGNVVPLQRFYRVMVVP